MEVDKDRELKELIHKICSDINKIEPERRTLTLYTGSRGILHFYRNALELGVPKNIIRSSVKRIYYGK